MKKVFITGGTGFIGQRVVDLLKGLPDVCVYALSRKEQDSYDNVTFIKGDIADTSLMENILNEVCPDTLLHLAWNVKESGYSLSEENYDWVRWSEELTQIFLQSGGKNIIGAGTCFEYDIDSPLPHVEDEIVTPNTPYGKSKVAAKEIIGKLCRDYNARFVWGRIFYPYGVGEESRKLISSAIRAWQQGEKFFCKTPNDVIDYIYVDDIAKILVTISLDVAVEGVINIGTGNGYRIGYILDIITGQNDYIDMADCANDYGRCIIADNKKLRRYYNEKFVTINEGITKMKKELCRKSPKDR